MYTLLTATYVILLNLATLFVVSHLEIACICELMLNPNLNLREGLWKAPCV